MKWIHVLCLPIPSRHLLVAVLATITIPFVNASTSSAGGCPDRRLTYDPGLSVTSYNTYCVSAGSNHRVHVVWSDNRGGSWQVYYKRSTDGGEAWSADTQLVQSSQSWEPAIVSSEEDVHVVWMDHRDGNAAIYYKRSTDGGESWSSDFRLTYDTANACVPALAVSGPMVHVVWTDNRTGRYQVFYKRSSNKGTTWFPDCSLSTIHYDLSVMPSVTASGSLVHVAWNDDQEEGDGEILYKRSTDGGETWSPDTSLTNDSAASYNPSVASTGSYVHLVWEGSSGDDAEILYKRSTDGGATWSGDVHLVPNDLVCEGPRLTARGMFVHLVWSAYSNYPPYVLGIFYKASLNAGRDWVPEFMLNSVPNFTLQPSVSAAEGIHVVWTDYRDNQGENNHEIYYSGTEGDYISGAEEVSKQKEPLRILREVCPNPFTSFAQVPGHEGERFSLYDVSGRKVGIFRGDRVGEGLAPGVYFLRSQDGLSSPVRVVKVR